MAEEIYKIDKHSDTWRAIEAWAKRQHADAVNALIADRDPDVQRGRIAMADELLGMADKQKQDQIQVDDYQ